MSLVHLLEFCFWLSLVFIVIPFIVPENWLVPEEAKARSRLLGYTAWELEYCGDRSKFMVTYRVLFFVIGALLVPVVPYVYLCFESTALLSYTSYLRNISQLLMDKDTPLWQFVLTENLLAGIYLGTGVVWAVGYFALYARRLGRDYVQLSTQWLAQKGLSEVPSGMSDALKQDYLLHTIAPIRDKMFYAGNFPLEAMDQKRFFVANVLIWPIAIVSYLFGDTVAHAASRVDKALMARLERRWRKHMPLVAADHELALAYKKQISEVVLAKAGSR